jgi:hypothetical protein
MSQMVIPQYDENFNRAKEVEEGPPGIRSSNL